MQAHSHDKPVASPVSLTAPLPVHYANYFRVSGAPGELFLDLGVISRGAAAKAEAIPCERRIAMTPFTAKRMLGAMAAALKHYEQIFGCIEIDDHHPHVEKKHASYGESPAGETQAPPEAAAAH